MGLIRNPSYCSQFVIIPDVPTIMFLADLPLQQFFLVLLWRCGASFGRVRGWRGTVFQAQTILSIISIVNVPEVLD